MSDEKAEKIESLGITEIDKVKEHDTEYGKFTIRVLLPYEKTHVINRVSQLCDVTKVFPDEAEFVRMLVTLPICVKKPDDFPDYDDCHDEDFLYSLYKEYQDLEASLQKKLKKNRERKSKIN